jgi:hypothetical protein
MMQIAIATNHKKGHTIPIDIDRFPDECPYCHRAIDPNFLYGFHHMERKYLHLSFYCPKNECGMHFVGYYFQESPPIYIYRSTLLGQLKRKEFSETITNISADFISIFNQASTAEHNGLDQICGVGYRKALEFLIKDYIISKDASLRDVVERSMLGKCINDYIEDERIKNIAKRATWLGNDETHYVRKWVGKNISDLKLLIELTVHWIETEDLTQRIISSMPE